MIAPTSTHDVPIVPDLGEARAWAVLAERCEAATGPDRELDVAIGEVVYGGARFIQGVGYRRWYAATRRWAVLPDLTASLDAAMTLVPEGAFWSLTMNGRRAGFEATVVPDGSMEWHYGVTPALALCAAALRARATGATPDER